MIFKVGDKVLLNKEGFREIDCKHYYEKWNGKPLTVEKIHRYSGLPIQTKERINGTSIWAEKELTLAREENEL